MSRASHRIPASLLITFAAYLVPQSAAAALRVTVEPTPLPLRIAVPAAPDERPAVVYRHTAFAPDTATGTVSDVHADDATIEVITGVQFALRVLAFRVVEETRIQRSGGTIALEQLAPGDIVRVDYRATPEGNVANSIQVVAVPDEGGAR